MRQLFGSFPIASNPQTVSRLSKAMEYIEENLFAELSVEAIAEVEGLSVPWLTRMFKQICGVTAMQWREEKRITIACHQLMHSNRQVGLISDELGYKSF